MSSMRIWTAAAIGLIGAITPATAVSVRCGGPLSSPAEQIICQDAQLLKQDEEMERKMRLLLPRLSYGQYLGLRYWESRGAEERDQCGTDRACIGAQYRAQQRFLDTLRQCLDHGGRKRMCWQAMQGFGSVALPR